MSGSTEGPKKEPVDKVLIGLFALAIVALVLSIFIGQW